MNDHLAILQAAIADVGYWRWWTFDNSRFQVEFGGVQLYIEPTEEGAAPSGIIALRFENLESAAFLLRESCGDRLPSDWFSLLAEDRVEPPSLSREEFWLTDAAMVSRAVADASSIKPVHSSVNPRLSAIDGRSFLAFWAGNAGLYVVAERLSVLSHEGVIPPAVVQEKSDAWWAYWREYWRRKDAQDPMPRDYACEVTIPAGE